MPEPTILIIDDEHLIRSSLRTRLEKSGYRVLEAENGREGTEIFRRSVDLVVLDHRLPDSDGLALLRAFRSRDPDTPVIWMTPFAANDGGLEAIKEGAYHTMTKPFKLDEMMLLVQKALETTRLKREVRALRAAQSQAFSFESIIGESPVMRDLKAKLTRIPPSSNAPVLLVGESGSGKDLVAKVIHFNGDRLSRPFLSINCGAHPESVLDGELFGLERVPAGVNRAVSDPKKPQAPVAHEGLFERAEGGTVFLDDIDELPAALQAKLIRAIDEHLMLRAGGTADVKVDVRVIAATSKNVEEAVQQGRFREDLFRRLSGTSIVLPALRERQGDVPILVQYYVDLFNREFKKRVRGAAPEATALLERHHWRGNIRELRNAIERAMLLTDRDQLTPADFDLRSSADVSNPARVLMLPPEGVNFEELERDLVIQALERTGGNQTRAATLLGMKRDQIRYRVEKFGLTRTGRRRPTLPPAPVQQVAVSVAMPAASTDGNAAVAVVSSGNEPQVRNSPPPTNPGVQLV